MSEKIETPFIEGVIETVGIKVGNLIIVNIYRPPSGNRQMFIDEMSNLLDNYNQYEIVLMGDFNINFRNQNLEIDTLWNRYGINAKIKGITRIASGTCLDNFITNLDGNQNNS